MEVWIARHGETEWSRRLKHTSRTDVGLTPRGEEQARALGAVLAGHTFVRVLSSPLRRALDTARLAGFAEPEIVGDLTEFGYGDYEGLTTKEIREERPDWDLWRDGCPGGETAGQVGVRMDRVIELLGDPAGDVLVFAHGHCLRILGARWLGLEPAEGRLFLLDPASLSILGFERERPVLRLWNRPGSGQS